NSVAAGGSVPGGPGGAVRPHERDGGGDGLHHHHRPPAGGAGDAGARAPGGREHRLPGGAGHPPRHRPGPGPADHRLPGGQRPLHHGGGPAGGEGHRRGNPGGIPGRDHFGKRAGGRRNRDGGGKCCMKILVVDDEKLLVKGIKFNLENEGYQVECAYNGADAVELARTGTFDLIILDLMMPEIDGLEACMRIREFSNVPIIMLTARGEDADKIIGFECGADDYITKPFNILELKARIRAMLRRAGGGQARQDSTITIGSLTLDTDQRIALRHGEPVELTAKEYDLIELLMKNPRRVYSRKN